MLKKLEQILRDVEGEILWNEYLANHTSFRVGGPADAYVYPKDIRNLAKIFRRICEEGLPYLVVGDGSNLLAPDEGFRGIVLNLSHFDQLKILKKGDRSIDVFVGAGLRKQKFLSWAVQKGFSGVEFLSGVPGQVGGGLFMNAGTASGSFGNIVTKIYLVNAKGDEEKLSVGVRDFSYRAQTFCRQKIITAATVRLSYGNVADMKRRVKEMISDRKDKQPLQYPNCGSTFVNPPRLIAGKLIESAGFKGFRVGNAMVSEKHANFIVNLGNATSRDILSIIETVEHSVKSIHGVSLRREVVVIDRQR